MSGKLSRKERAKLQSEQHKAQATEPSAAPKKKPQAAGIKPQLKESTLIKRLNLILILLAFGVYCNSLVNEYALDDYGLILENSQTKQGTSALGQILSSAYRTGTTNGDNTLYRPLSKMMFAVEWQLGSGGPALGHFMNVALFALTVVLLFRMLRRYLGGSITVPFITAVLFAVHPIHTEVVANIKGRDDILCFLFFVCSAIYVHRFVIAKKTKDLVFAAATFFLCTLSKESAITFVAVFPLLLYFFTTADRSTFIKVVGTTGGVAVVFLLIRAGVLHGGGPSSVPVVDNYIAGIDGFFAQRATAITIAGIYLLKLFVPYGLVSDASTPQMPPYGFGDWQFLLSLAVFIAMIVFAVRTFKQKHPVSFGILFFFITFSMVSNIPFLIGTNYAERLLYTPSLGIFMAVAWALHRFLGAAEEQTEQPGAYFSSQKKAIAVLAVAALAYSGITILRNPAWKDNLTLYTTDCAISPNSCKLHYFYANHLTITDTLAQYPENSPEWTHRVDTAIVEFRKSLELNPSYAEPMQRLGDMYFFKKQIDSAEYYYRRAIWRLPMLATIRNNFGTMLFKLGRYEEAQYQFETATRFSASYATPWNNLAGCYGTKASQYVMKMQTDPANAEAHKQKAIELFQKSLNASLTAINADPAFINAYETTAQTYNNLGDQVNAQKYTALAQQINNSGQGHR